MSFVIADMKIWIIFFCKCGQIFDHIIISPPCKFLTVFLFAGFRPFSRISFLAGWTAAFIHKAASFHTPSPGIVSRTSPNCFFRKSRYGVFTQRFYKNQPQNTPFPYSPEVLRFHQYRSIPDAYLRFSCSSEWLYKGLPVFHVFCSFSLFSQQISVCQMRMDHFRKHFGIII